MRHSAEQLADLHSGEEFQAIRLELRDGEVGYWTVLDGNLHRVLVVDEFLVRDRPLWAGGEHEPGVRA